MTRRASARWADVNRLRKTKTFAAIGQGIVIGKRRAIRMLFEMSQRATFKAIERSLVGRERKQMRRVIDLSGGRIGARRKRRRMDHQIMASRRKLTAHVVGQGIFRQCTGCMLVELL